MFHLNFVGMPVSWAVVSNYFRGIHFPHPRFQMQYHPPAIKTAVEHSPYAFDSFAFDSGHPTMADGADQALSYSTRSGRPYDTVTTGKHPVTGAPILVPDLNASGRFSDTLPVPECLTDKYRTKVLDWNDPQNIPQLNNVSGECSSLTYYDNPRKVYEDMVTAAWLPAQHTDGRGPHGWCSTNPVPLKQLTADWVVKHIHTTPQEIGLRERNAGYKFNPQLDTHVYNGMNYQAEHHPGSASEGMLTGSLHFQLRLLPNATATIQQFYLGEMCKSDLHPRDKGFVIKIHGALEDKLQAKIVNPYPKAGHEDSLGAPVEANYGEPFYAGGYQSEDHSPKIWVQTVQQAIAWCESIGINWVYRHWHSRAIERDTHALYTHNFPYRGQFKFPVRPSRAEGITESAGKYKRQEGGNDRPAESKDHWHPYTIDHFKPFCGHPSTRIAATRNRGKTEEELWA
eukprot:TRINITY_DN21_c0_g1_i1.p1 TRINITY_DN21_c0_g1~~TRINITY_DN21_c0_g1_i1.p1  ORF type:complete len:488 (+),score=134.85 TRINITY_DN21_c0_g1_i1:101-1465(+)